MRGFYLACRTWVSLSDFDGVTFDGQGRTKQIQLSRRLLRVDARMLDWVDAGWLAILDGAGSEQQRPDR